MSYRLAIFDMDGTILYTLEDLMISVNHALRLEGLPERTLDDIRVFVGNGIRKTIERAVPGGTPVNVIDRLFNEFNEHYKLHSNDHTRPYDGIVDVIGRIKENGVMTACVSNKSDFAVQDLVKIYFDGLFDYSVGAKEGKKLKPAPDSVNDVLQTLKMDRKDAVYIGDSNVDLETAVNSGLPCISVLWGFRDREFLIKHGATTFAGVPAELYDLICKDV